MNVASFRTRMLRWFAGEKTPEALARLFRPSVVFSREMGPKVYVSPKQLVGVTLLSCGVCCGAGYTLLNFVDKGKEKVLVKSTSVEQERLRKMLRDAKNGDWRDNLDAAGRGMSEFMKPPVP
ncbi:hypothetical protein TrRE_jg11917 [Triparma retinervis]|uniref:Uncharacterized protein n=1 Tax=Triparma retinervis TaxID=2557542 RepID=A0A9W7EDJ3_9STRA|nr:hypothetical protein TrRE_jg11917 [Triparma retinervis]